MELSRQEYCSGYPFPAPADLPDPETEARPPAPPGATSVAPHLWGNLELGEKEDTSKLNRSVLQTT